MEKAFESLTRMDDLYCAICPHKKGDCNECEYNQKSNIVYQALTELKAIKEAKPSEALKELEQNIKDRIILAEDRQLKLCATIKQTLLKAQENEKVLEILKPLCEVVETPIRKDRYLKINGVVVYTFKNEEEFELLKRWSGK